MLLLFVLGVTLSTDPLYFHTCHCHLILGMLQCTDMMFSYSILIWPCYVHLWSLFAIHYASWINEIINLCYLKEADLSKNWPIYRARISGWYTWENRRKMIGDLFGLYRCSQAPKQYINWYIVFVGQLLEYWVYLKGLSTYLNQHPWAQFLFLISSWSYSTSIV